MVTYKNIRLLILLMIPLSIESSEKLSKASKAFMAYCYGAPKNINSVEHNGFTPLENAIRYNHLVKIAALIKQGADVNLPDKFGASPLDQAVQNYCCDETLTYLINHGADINAQDDVGFTALHTAASMLNFNAVKLLIEFNIDINTTSYSGNTALITLLSKGNLNSQSEKNIQTKIAKLLINAGANICIQSSDHKSPLQLTKHQVRYFSMDPKIEEYLKEAHTCSTTSTSPFSPISSSPSEKSI